MKLTICAVIAVLVGGAILLSPRGERVPSHSDEATAITNQAITKRAQNPAAGFWRREAKSRHSIPVQRQEAGVLKTERVVHVIADFQRGEHQNTVTTDGLHLSESATSATQGEPYRYSGVYTSEEETATHPFNALVPELKNGGTNEGEITLEFRTKDADGQWAKWRTIRTEDLNAPALVSSPAVGWQYRLTLHGNDLADGPRVTEVAATVHFAEE